MPREKLPDNIPLPPPEVTAALQGKMPDPLLMHEMLIRSAPHTFAEAKSPYGYEKWVAAKHLAYISTRIVKAMARGPEKPMRFLVAMPPRHGKSMLISKWLPIWYLDNFPTKRVMMCSYNEQLAMEWGRKVRDEFARNGKLFTKLREDVKSSTFWHTDKGGSMLSAGLTGGSLKGRGFHLGIIDDAVKTQAEADSPVFNAANVQAFNSDFYTRREAGGAHIVVLMQRMSHNDLIGYLMREHKDPWEYIKLPLYAGENDPLGRSVGDVLWPERFPASEFSGIDALTLTTQYQQEPPNELSTRVYHNYTDAMHLDPSGQDTKLSPDKYHLPLMMALDFNVNPGMHAIIGQYIRTGQDTFLWRHEIHGHRMKTIEVMREFEKLLKNYYGWTPGNFKWPVLEVYGDRSGRSDSSATVQTDYQQIEQFLAERKIPYILKVPFNNPPVKFRVQTVNDALQDQTGGVHMRIHKDCQRLIKDFATQPTDVNGLPSDMINIPDKSNDLLGHAGDACGYAVVWLRPLRRIIYKPQRQMY